VFVGYGFILGTSLLFAISYFFYGIQQRPVEDTIFAIIFAAIAVYLIYVLWGIIFKKFYIELTPTIINIRVPFKNLSLSWDQLAEVRAQRRFNRIYLAILLKGDVGRNYSYLVPLIYFMDIDLESLVNTFNRNIKKLKKANRKSLTADE